MTKHAEGARGTHGKGQNAVKEEDLKHLKNTKETIRATQGVDNCDYVHDA